MKCAMRFGIVRDQQLRFTPNTAWKPCENLHQSGQNVMTLTAQLERYLNFAVASAIR
ncbi:hypothetical protein [Cerasicoccus arenae]|uniref:hypothetical protein n=1 Tax=Cerasicoccus arenae TaxID=424488 RepID=UPI001E6023D1|nr:hypothetical protein [Cerasicoccus arenae]